MKQVLIRFAIAAACLIGATSSNAHHSFAAQFDREQSVTFTGTVTKVEWTNPHARFYVEGADPEMESGENVTWNIELVSANVLMRQGWRHDTLAVGDVVSVSATRARKDPHVVNGSRVVRGEDIEGDDQLFRRRADQVND